MTTLKLRRASSPFSSAFLRFFFLLLPWYFLIATSPALAASGSGQKKAEKPYALIYGTVYGPDDHTVYGVRVRIRRSDQKKAKWELYSDHAGEFAQRVPAGKADYIVWADLKGSKGNKISSLQDGEPVTVHIENDERADISLHLK
ncbi:MAG TPA: hypothetical protein VFI95_06585 [Terriglobales bacterium]|nr:hypothetical protein [Terriglobales bacterium]